VNILCTGSAGYVGSVIVDELVANGHDVVALDDLSSGHRQAVNEKAHFIQGDVGDKELLGSIMSHNWLDVVIHLANEANVSNSMTNPRIYFQTNVVKGLVLLDVMVKYGVKKMIYSSSAAVYGNRNLCQEEDGLKPINAYGESKVMFENILKYYKLAYGLDYITFRYFNVAGATIRGQDTRPETHLISCVLNAVFEGKAVNVYGIDYKTKDGTCIRDYIHVSDVAQAHLCALKNGKYDGEVYNLGNLSGYSVLDVVNCAREVLGTVIPVNICPRRDGDPPVLISDSSMARLRLGWKPKYAGLKEIIQSAWDWKLKNPKGYND
jgi:UDP-glucose 4-epimerase